MYKITKTFENFDGVEISEDFYFNMSEAELVDAGSSDNGSFLTILKKIIREKDTGKMMEYFREIVLMSYGEKSADSKHFFKTPEIRNNFQCHAAFSDIYMELANDDKKAQAFIKGIFPKKLASQIDFDKIDEKELKKIVES